MRFMRTAPWLHEIPSQNSASIYFCPRPFLFFVVSPVAVSCSYLHVIPFIFSQDQIVLLESEASLREELASLNI